MTSSPPFFLPFLSDAVCTPPPSCVSPSLAAQSATLLGHRAPSPRPSFLCFARHQRGVGGCREWSALALCGLSRPLFLPRGGMQRKRAFLVSVSPAGSLFVSGSGRRRSLAAVPAPSLPILPYCPALRSHLARGRGLVRVLAPPMCDIRRCTCAREPDRSGMVGWVLVVLVCFRLLRASSSLYELVCGGLRFVHTHLL